MELAIPIIAALVFGAVGFSFGRSTGRAAGVEEGREAAGGNLRSMIEAVRRGRVPEGLRPGSAEADLQAALEQGWAPREAERALVLREAVARVSTFLSTSVKAPLTGFATNVSMGELKERIGRALGSLQDLDFFMSEIGEAREGTDLSKLSQVLSREFAYDQDVGVRLMVGSESVRAVVNPAALKDVLYLVLHNAARFGGATTIDLSVESEDGRAKIVVRDRGEGFSKEAFSRAFDPFYSTSDEGLGLGLPHARRVLEEMGGKIELRNVPDGGAEVELSFPAA
jgi:signal transduction histidine kinase